MRRRMLVAALALIGCSKPIEQRSISPQAELDALDGRQPLYLLPIMAYHQKQSMQEHLLAVQDVVGALARGDLAAAADAAGRLGTSEAMTRQCNHMGAATPGFAERALAFHSTADSIVQAAKAGDPIATLAALERTLATCTSCHAAFRQQVVGDATWDALTAAGAD